MRIAFFGTPDIAVRSFDALVAAPDVDVVVAVTNPDRPRGRSGRARAPAVKTAALHAGVEVLQPVRPDDVADELHERALDAAAVVAYGSILSRRMLDTARLGFVNLHFSLLPRWRGAAPVQHALLAGDTSTGVTTFVLDEGMDTGPIVDQLAVTISPEETAGELLGRLAQVGAPLLVESLRRLDAGATPQPQPTQGATYAPKITADDTRVDWSKDTRDVANHVRGLSPRPGAQTTFRSKRLKILRAAVVDVAGGQPPGTLLEGGIDVACGTGALRLVEVQPEGRRVMSARDFVNGHSPRAGERFE